MFPRPRVIAHDFLYLIAALPLGIVAFTVVVTGLSLGLGMLITLLGIPILLATFVACRGLAIVERLRAAPVLGEPIAPTERRWRQDGPWATTKAIVTDPAAWRDLLWATILGPIGIATFTIAVTLWSATIGLVFSPAWWWANDSDDTIPLIDSTSLGWSVLRVLIGLVLVPVTIWACRALAEGTARLARLTLGPIEPVVPGPMKPVASAR
jgi:Putative sensor